MLVVLLALLFAAVCLGLFVIVQHLLPIAVGVVALAVAVVYAVVYQPLIATRRIPSDWPRWKIDGSNSLFHPTPGSGGGASRRVL